VARLLGHRLQFQKGALLRDQIEELKRAIDRTKSETGAKPVGYRKSRKVRG
jgi:hypothetical protein